MNAEPRQHVTLHVATSTIVKILGVIALVCIAWFIRDVLGMLFVAMIFSSAIDPTVDALERFHIPRAISILAMYLGFFCAFVLVFYLIIPPVVAQFSSVSTTFSSYKDQIDSLYQAIVHNSNASVFDEVQKHIVEINSAIGQYSSSLFSKLANLFGTLAKVVFVFVITFYITIKEDTLKNVIRLAAPIGYQPYLIQKLNRVQQKMGSWLRGELVLMTIIGVLTFIGLTALRIPNALLLAIIAGFAEAIPYFGPILSAVPAVFFGYTQSSWQALAVLALFVLIQQSENQIIVPQVMRKAVGIHPVVSISSMLIGAKVAGVIGIFLAIPVATVVSIFIEDFITQKRAAENELEKQHDETHSV